METGNDNLLLEVAETYVVVGNESVTLGHGMERNLLLGGDVVGTRFVESPYKKVGMDLVVELDDNYIGMETALIGSNFVCHLLS